MAQITKPIAALIGVGIFLVLLFHKSQVQSEGLERAVGKKEASKTGAWQDTEFTHMIDYKFGASLVYILVQNGITSLTDMGCGTGHYAKMINDFNIKTQGFDGNPETKKWDVSGGLCVGPVDLTEPKSWEETDAAMSIEVGEHIPAEYEKAFLDNVVSSARSLIFLSWGVPGQGGEGHVNGKTGEDVVKEMNQRGWQRNDDLTTLLQNDSTFPWIRANVQVYTKSK